MALVRISNSLIQEVVDNVMSMRDKQLSTLEVVSNSAFVDPWDFRVIGGYYDRSNSTVMRAKQSPGSWFYRTSAITGHITFVRGDKQHEAVFTFAPHKGSDFYIPHGTTYSAHCRPKGDVSLFPEAKPYVDYVNQRMDITERWADVSNQVTAFIKAHPSLNKAVKEWEGLRMYIPGYYLSRLDEETTKTAKAKVEPPKIEIDKDALTVAAVEARFT